MRNTLSLSYVFLHIETEVLKCMSFIIYSFSRSQSHCSHWRGSKQVRRAYRKYESESIVDKTAVRKKMCTPGRYVPRNLIFMKQQKVVNDVHYN